MPGTMAAAFAAAAGPDLDAALGLETAPYRAAPPDPEMAAAFADLRSTELRRVARRLASHRRCHLSEADDAVQDALLDLWGTRPELFRRPAERWLGYLYEQARNRLREVRPAEPKLSTDALLADGDSVLATARACVRETDSAAEECRHLLAPGCGGEWTREQMLGAIQRFRDYHGRPPKASDFRALHGLPSLSTVYRHFESLGEALLAAGMVPDSGIVRHRPWTAVEAARACRAFRRRNARWPSWHDVKSRPAELPSTSVLIRCFYGTRSIDVQLRAEAILEAVGEPTA